MVFIWRLLLCSCELHRLPEISRAIVVCLILIAFNGCVTNSSGGLTMQLKGCRPCETYQSKKDSGELCIIITRTWTSFDGFYTECSILSGLVFQPVIQPSCGMQDDLA